MSATTNDIKKQAFENTIPLRIEIEDQSIPFCFNAHRSISLGVFVYLKLESFLPAEKRIDMWFSSNSTQVKWTLPLGVLYDSLKTQDSKGFSTLNIKINFSNFPATTYLRCESLDRARYYICHLFKESTFLLKGNADLLTNNSKIQEHVEMAIESNNYEELIQHFSKLFDDDIDNWKRWPIKTIADDQLTVLGGYLEVDRNKTIDDLLQSQKLESKEKVLIQGIEIPKTSKLFEIVPALVNADGFLYVIPK